MQTDETTPSTAEHDAAMAETGDTKATLVFKDEELPLVGSDELPALELSEALGKLERGDVGGIAETMQVVLGPANYRRLKALKPNLDDLSDIVDKVLAAYGFGSPGESKASSD